MVERYEPQPGVWYKSAAGDSFEVLAVDNDQQLISIRYFDGSVVDIPASDWDGLGLSIREPPAEEWAVLDEVALNEQEDALTQPLWSGPLDYGEGEAEWGD